MKKFKVILSAILCAVLALACLPLSACEKEETPDYDLTDLDTLDRENLLAAGDKPVVKWEGRYEYKDDRVYLYHTATGFTVDFTGTELEVTFYHDKSDIYYEAALDEEVLPNPNPERRFYLPDGEEEYTWKISGLTEGKHTVRCLKADEAKDATTAVVGMKTDGKFVYRNEEADSEKVRFMVVCASGGSGYGSLGYSEVSNTAVSRTRKNSSSLHAFAFLTARMFDADIQFVASSGWGVALANKSVVDILDYTGVTTSDNVAGAKTTAVWDSQRYIPDVILLNVGGNDGVTNANKDAYQKRVVELVEKLHADYPYASIVWVHTSSKYWSYTQTGLSDAGIKYVLDCEIPNVGEGETGAGTYGASNHVSLKTHIDASEIIANLLSERIGYGRVRNNISFAQYIPFLDTDCDYHFTDNN